MKRYLLRHVRTLSLCLLSSLAFAAVAASSASAKLPEWGQCLPTVSGSGGKFANAACTQPVKKVYGILPGGYEWHPLVRTTGEIESGDQTKLDGTDSEAPNETFRFASGREIVCHAGRAEEESKLPLDGSNTVTDAADFAASSCEEPVLALENEGEPGLGEFGLPGNCHTAGVEPGEVNSHPEFRNGRSNPPTGTTWTGKTAFLSSRTSPTPSAGISYQTSPGAERFFPELNCESGLHSEPLSIQIGGHKKSERLVAEIAPVNTMLSSGFTATLKAQAKDGLEAIVNTGSWEAVAIEATFSFGEENYLGYEYRLANDGGTNRMYENSLEFKATP